MLLRRCGGCDEGQKDPTVSSVNLRVGKRAPFYVHHQQIAFYVSVPHSLRAQESLRRHDLHVSFCKTKRNAPTAEALRQAVESDAALSRSERLELERLPPSAAWGVAQAASRMMHLQPSDARWQGAGCASIGAVVKAVSAFPSPWVTGSSNLLRWADADTVAELATALLAAVRSFSADINVQEPAIEALALLAPGPLVQNTYYSAAINGVHSLNPARRPAVLRRRLRSLLP